MAPFALGLFGVADLSFYEALASPEVAGEREAELARWAEQCPENFAHKVDLVAALRLAAAGDRWAAMARFERSIEGARAQGFTQDEAMARERLAEFLKAEGMPGVAASAAAGAVAAWRRWGAGPKADALARRWSSEAVRHPRGNTTGEAELSFDALSVAKASQALSEHVVLNLLLERVVRVVLESAGGTGGALLLDEDGALTVRARGEAGEGAPVDLAPLRLDECPDLPRSVLELTFRTAEPVVLADAAGAGQFVDDPAVRARTIRSVLCVPLRYGGRVAGLVYLESLVATRAFTRDRVDLVQHLATQLAISLQNSHLFESLRREVRERERAEEALLRANDDLEARIASRTAELERVAQSEREAREALERTQAHLVQSEKLASLGQMVAGIAHEINNPLSFVNNNVAVLQRDVTAAMEILDAWGESRPALAERDPALAARIDAMSERLDLGYVKGRLPGVFKSTREGMRRITQIVADLRVFARLDLGDSEEADLHAGVSSTLHILRVRAEGRGVALVADLGRPVRVRCQPAKVNQVVMNLVANAIDATPAGSAVMVTTRHRPGWFELIVDDEGDGVPEALRTRIFDPFFTTKPQGEGTGLGLSISYGIAREHGGEVTVGDAPGGGARFTLRLPME
ncbi:MAG: ATP-binding protein [Polyangiales bacterium]